MRATKLFVAAVAASTLTLSALPEASAIPITYEFSVTATTGPLSSSTASGTFSFDSSSIILGGVNVAVGLLTDLDFTWNGVTYDETTANTGRLEFDAAGELTVAVFGNDCFAGGCSVGAFSNQWYVVAPFQFVYATAGSSIFSGSVTFSEVTTAVPEPSSLALLAIGFAGMALTGITGTRRRT